MKKAGLRKHVNCKWSKGYTRGYEIIRCPSENSSTFSSRFAEKQA